MPAWKGTLNEQQIWQVIEYIYALKAQQICIFMYN